MSGFDRGKTFGFSDSESSELKDKLLKIAKLLGSSTTSIGDTTDDCYTLSFTYGDLNKGVFLVNFGKVSIKDSGEDAITSLSRKMIRNVDRKRKTDVPPVLMNFLHELAHSLAVTGIGDLERYTKDRNNFTLDYYNKGKTDEQRGIAYRKLPHEKLADNLGYELYVQNKTAINKILNGEKVNKSKKRDERNTRLAKEFKDKYIYSLN